MVSCVRNLDFLRKRKDFMKKKKESRRNDDSVHFFFFFIVKWVYWATWWSVGFPLLHYYPPKSQLIYYLALRCTFLRASPAIVGKIRSKKVQISILATIFFIHTPTDSLFYLNIIFQSFFFLKHLSLSLSLSPLFSNPIRPPTLNIQLQNQPPYEIIKGFSSVATCFPHH
jgi:hypothetical protein